MDFQVPPGSETGFCKQIAFSLGGTRNAAAQAGEATSHLIKSSEETEALYQQPRCLEALRGGSRRVV